jgi:hypothetical protein
LLPPGVGPDIAGEAFFHVCLNALSE